MLQCLCAVEFEDRIKLYTARIQHVCIAIRKRNEHYTLQPLHSQIQEAPVEPRPQLSEHFSKLNHASNSLRQKSRLSQHNSTALHSHQ